MQSTQFLLGYLAEEKSFYAFRTSRKSIKALEPGEKEAIHVDGIEVCRNN